MQFSLVRLTFKIKIELNQTKLIRFGLIQFCARFLLGHTSSILSSWVGSRSCGTCGSCIHICNMFMDSLIESIPRWYALGFTCLIIGLCKQLNVHIPNHNHFFLMSKLDSTFASCYCSGWTRRRVPQPSSRFKNIEV